MSNVSKIIPFPKRSFACVASRDPERFEGYPRFAKAFASPGIAPAIAKHPPLDRPATLPHPSGH